MNSFGLNSNETCLLFIEWNVSADFQNSKPFPVSKLNAKSVFIMVNGWKHRKLEVFGSLKVLITQKTEFSYSDCE